MLLPGVHNEILKFALLMKSAVCTVATGNQSARFERVTFLPVKKVDELLDLKTVIDFSLYKAQPVTVAEYSDNQTTAGILGD